MYAAYGRRAGSVYGNTAGGKMSSTLGNPLFALIGAGVSAVSQTTSSIISTVQQNKASKGTPQGLAAEKVRLEHEIQQAAAKGNSKRVQELRSKLSQVKAGLAALGIGLPPVNAPKSNLGPWILGGAVVLTVGIGIAVVAGKD